MSTLEQQIANLRLQLDALEKATKTASLPDAVIAMRRTMKWGAIVIALALVLSSLIRMTEDGRVRALERRVEQLEKSRSM